MTAWGAFQPYPSSARGRADRASARVVPGIACAQRRSSAGESLAATPAGTLPLQGLNKLLALVPAGNTSARSTPLI